MSGKLHNIQFTCNMQDCAPKQKHISAKATKYGMQQVIYLFHFSELIVQFCALGTTDLLTDILFAANKSLTGCRNFQTNITAKTNITEWITGKCIEKQHDTRNHRFALQQSHVHYDMRKFNFSNKIIPIWNSLPDYVVEISEIDTETKTEIIKNRTQFCMEGL